MSDVKAAELGVANLAFLGDAVYELLVREEVAKSTNMPSITLHQNAVKKVCAKAQAAAYNMLKTKLTEQEYNILKRGRNHKINSCPKNASPIEYKKATGLETLFGYLYLTGNYARIREIFDYIFAYLEECNIKESGEEMT